MSFTRRWSTEVSHRKVHHGAWTLLGRYKVARRVPFSHSDELPRLFSVLPIHLHFSSADTIWIIVFASAMMDGLLSFLPSAEDGILPYYLLLVSAASIGNAIQNYLTLHYTRRIYNGLFVPNSTVTNGDSVQKLQPVSSAATLKDKPTATDQVTPLAARLFGIYTIAVGVIRLYGAYNIHDGALYQLCIFTHMLAGFHFTSEIVVYKTLRLAGPHIFPFSAAFGGTLWMVLQYSNYVKA
ncbi:Erg28 like protein-domain-containing protein [Coniella lustricola]|uniref:Erg28 like protein-domain-containing protein n=1 Tax=Coniella lustricola TaxID=2025994 RepID=A0A2T3ANH0_9PEZI|nr:Erg28 like protein-domain-containing protein [Coniella lustricola]